MRAALEWVRAVFLPRYAPELNPLETLSSHFKRVLKTLLFRNPEELEQVIRAHRRLVHKRPNLRHRSGRIQGPLTR